MDYGFDTKDVKFDTLNLPLGLHKVMIIGEEVKETKKETNPRTLEVTFEVLATKKSYKYLYNIFNKSEQTANIAKQALKKIAGVTGSEVNASNPLKSRVLQILVVPQTSNSDYVNISKYFPEDYVPEANLDAPE
jgi:hypothetical protein